MELKGSKTEKNLREAFAGESQARNKYTYFASVAKKEGFVRFTLGEDITIDVDYDQVVIVLEGAKISSNTKKLNDLDVKEHYKYYLDQGLNDKDAMKKVAKDRGVSKSDIYKLIKI